MDDDARDDDASDDAVADDDWMTLQHPSDDFPAPSPFRLRVPTGWGAMVSADADLAVAQRDVVGRFRPNVIVKVHRLPRPAGAQPDIDLDVLLTEDERLPGVEIVDDERREGGEAPARRRLMHYVGPVGAGGHAEAWAGARAGVEDHVTLFGDNVSAGGGVGVRAGVGGELGGDVSLTADRIGVEADIGAALGVGFDVHIDA